MKSGDFVAQLVIALAPLIAVGVIGLLIWRKIFGPTQTATDVVNNTIDAAASIPGGLASVASSILKGESEAGYISQDGAKAMAQRQLQLRLQGAL